MRNERLDHEPLDSPLLLEQSAELNALLRQHSEQIGDMMKLSSAKSSQVRDMVMNWSSDQAESIPAVDAFIGDIYSGLQVQAWSELDRSYAHRHLFILSGLYGMLRACDGIRPYRLEMGYKLPTGISMYAYWKAHADRLVQIIPNDTTHLINASSVEYTKALLPYTDLPVITPKFMTVSQKTGTPEFVTVHAKVARGAFARWIVQNQVESVEQLTKFAELNYRYDPARSSSTELVFVCKQFGGIGLSVRLT